MRGPRSGPPDRKRGAAPRVAVLKLLQDARGSLVSSRELRDKAGAGWRDAVASLRAAGYRVDETIGGSGNRSYRLAPSPATLEEQPKYLTEPAPLPAVPAAAIPSGKRARVSLTADDIRALLRGDVTPTARDSLVGGLMGLMEG